jgi:uncharacterized membrane protein (UPF0127 family)
MRSFVLLCAACALCGCSSRDGAATDLETLETKALTMPDGEIVRAEVMISPASQQRGMMFRGALPAGRGMLFWHKEVQPHSYWMYNVKVPLDIVFMDSRHRVLGVANAPPCTTRASDCPQYGGIPGTKFVLELNGGDARKYGVEPGKTIAF